MPSSQFGNSLVCPTSSSVFRSFHRIMPVLNASTRSKITLNPKVLSSYVECLRVQCGTCLHLLKGSEQTPAPDAAVQRPIRYGPPSRQGLAAGLRCWNILDCHASSGLRRIGSHDMGGQDWTACETPKYRGTRAN